MTLEPGAAVLGGDDVAETRGNDGSVSAGDAVMLDANGDMTAADTEAGDLSGVMTETGQHGLSGTFVVAAGDAVAAGNRVGAGNGTGTSTGTVIADSAGQGVALSDTGGTWQGYDVPAGYAVVHF